MIPVFDLQKSSIASPYCEYTNISINTSKIGGEFLSIDIVTIIET